MERELQLEIELQKTRLKLLEAQMVVLQGQYKEISAILSELEKQTPSTKEDL